MSNTNRRPENGPRGPEGVPVDAPDNDGPALSPHAVSRVHRAEDDGKAIAHSVDFSDDRAVADDRRSTDRESGTQSSPPRDNTAERLTNSVPPKHEPNPSHHTAKEDAEAPRGRGDGELMEQPSSGSAARQPGAKPGE